jgi:hypothetical protein
MFIFCFINGSVAATNGIEIYYNSIPAHSGNPVTAFYFAAGGH